ncbi:MAG: hypothetical protein ABI633_00980 [Burkholderiales bacterium]
MAPAEPVRLPITNTGIAKNTHNSQVINLRLDVLRIALIEIAMNLPTDHARRAAIAILKQVSRWLDEETIGKSADRAMAADLAPLLASLNRTDS